MTWRIVNACEVGTSHVAVGRPCEDSSWASVDADASGPVLSIFVADGAGSAARGGEGAEIAVQAASQFVSDRLAQQAFEASDELATDLVLAVRERLYAAADAESRTARDFACTLLGVVSSAYGGTVVLQIGDGGVVLDTGNGLEVPVEPMTGEYANMTRFATDEDAVSRLVTKTFDGPARRVAVFSDGLQRLALNMADNTAHEPFFAPFFKVLANSKPDQEDDLTAALVRFLSSASVNERTDDDKSLALAVLVD